MTRTRTIYIAGIQDPVIGEVTVLEASTAEELDALIGEFTADPRQPAEPGSRRRGRG